MDKRKLPSPVELVGTWELADMFTYFINHNFSLDNTSSFLAQPASVQPISYKFQTMRREFAIQYFKELIQAWDQGRKEEYLATLN